MEYLREDIQELEDSLREDIEKLNETYDADSIEIETSEIPPRKGDLKAETPMIVWMPWEVDEDGIAEPLFEFEEA